MFRKPSIKTLTAAFGDKAPAIRKVLETAESPRKALEACDSIIEGHGVEYIPKGRNSKSPAICYINLGDPYDTTLLSTGDNVQVGCWGNYAEHGNYD